MSEELQEVFWNLSEDQKVFVVEDWIKQGRPAQHLTEEKMADLDAEQAYNSLSNKKPPSTNKGNSDTGMGEDQINNG